MAGGRPRRRRAAHAALGAAALSPLAGPRPAAAAGFRVGVGRGADPYATTQRAVQASGEWPSSRMAGRTVLIKPNLVAGQLATTGITTDPQVVRALVDLALAAGAAKVVIVEGGQGEAKFDACGYGFFRTYRTGRVALLDLNEQPVVLAPVSGGLAYHGIYMPTLLFDASVVYVSAAKLKTHRWAGATLSVKNNFGLPAFDRYLPSASSTTRVSMHERGLHQTTVDLVLLRPIDFAVIDGIWGMEGNGPTGGTPIRADLVLAGQNAVAVDRAGLHAMQAPPARVQHLTYAALRGLGPADFAEVQLTGDPFTPLPFRQPEVPPILWRPNAVPRTFSPGSGQSAELSYRLDTPCLTRVDVVRMRDTNPETVHVRTLRDWTSRAAGMDRLTWDGRDDAGAVVPPEEYTVHVQGKYTADGERALATGWVSVS
ncbi:MAG TPA: DUF362 domain-containing protein [Chloroflexota bacterium]|jgi:uncharacterized protein (DUF362 family)|nr:DUF362 domain-containing protein [Chloroflexota bacterium]